MSESKPENLYDDEGMELLERAIERGPLHDSSAGEIRAFDNAVKDMLKDIARRADNDDGKD